MSCFCPFFIMSLKGRRFSLDSSVLDGVGVFGLRRGSSSISKKSRPSKSLDEARLKIHDFNQNLSSNMTLRDQTIAEEDLHQAQELNSHSLQKHNKSFHKLFQEISEGENLTDMFTCALQKEVLYHGKLYISENHACFHSSVLLKDTKVVIPVSSVTAVKKHSSALSMLSIQTADGDKFTFVSLRNREICYKLLQSVCSYVQQATPGGDSPPLSSADNEADRDAVSSYSSLEDSIDHNLRRQHSFDLGDFPQISSESPTRCSSAHQSILTGEDDQALSWIWKLTEKVFSFFLLREIRNLSVLFYIFIMLIALLLLVSGYIGLRIVLLEEQLNSLGALTELSLHHKEYQET
ncbi:GRAM domain-containing protein 2B-like isoform X3 [Solea solea]|uniref:GRAM domain-containing protein 2B-like isoform X3 n=1 Tax=Solea solea TaxID=90069 RepID=UPI00272A8838|nr:GRAM domain-containing protein 2B-like isoform X3 [Solea solea]